LVPAATAATHAGNDRAKPQTDGICSVLNGRLGFGIKTKAGLARKDQPGENTKIGLRFNKTILPRHF
jgi:hypothetical protein